MAVMVTTLSFSQLGALIRDKQVSLNNADLIFGQNYDAVKHYLQERLAADTYVMGIRGRINTDSVKLLSALDAGLNVDENRVIVEVNVPDDDILTFDASKLDDATQIMMYGLPEEMAFDQLDASQSGKDEATGIEVICTSKLRRSSNIRVTSLRRDDIVFDVEGITFVRVTHNS